MRGHVSPEEHATTRTPATDPNVDVGLSHGTGPSTNSEPRSFELSAQQEREPPRAKHQLCTHHDVRPKVDAERTQGITSVLQKQALVKERSRVLRAGNARTVLGLLALGGPDAASPTPGSWKDSTQDLEEGGGPSCAGAEKPAGWMGGRCFISSLFSSIRSKFFRPWALLIDLQNPTEQAMGTASPGGTWVY